MYLANVGYRSSIGRWPEQRINAVLTSAQEQERIRNYKQAAPIAYNTYVLALANGAKKDQVKPDDFNPFSTGEEASKYQEWDAIAVELLREHLNALPLWVFDILTQCGVKASEGNVKWKRSLSRVYGSRYCVGVDPFQVDGVWYWSILFFRDVDEVPDTIQMHSWDEENPDIVPVPGSLLNYWLEEGGVVYFGET